MLLKKLITCKQGRAVTFAAKENKGIMMKTKILFLIILCATLISCSKTDKEKSTEEQVLSLKLSTYMADAY